MKQIKPVSERQMSYFLSFVVARPYIDTYDMRVEVKLPHGTERTKGREEE